MSVPGSTFPRQTLVTSGDLQREHTALARQLLRRTLISSQSGPESPDLATDAGNGTITISGGGQRIVTPGGHLIIVDTAIEGLTIPSAQIPSSLYVIGLVYEEATSNPGPDAVSGTAQDRASSVAPRAVVYSAAQYSALPATTTDSYGATAYGQVSKDRFAAVAYGQYDSTGTLQLTTPSQLGVTLRATRAQAVGSAGDLTGIELVRFSSTTSPSDPFPETGSVVVAQLRLSLSGAVANISYKAPISGESFGATQNVAASPDGTEVTLLSATTSRTLRVRIYPSLFPQNDGLYEDDLTVVDLYGGLTIAGGKDTAHRGLLGSGLPTVNNPHGLTLEDAARLIDQVQAVIFGGELDGTGEAHVPHIRHQANDATNNTGTVGFALKREYVGNTSSGAVNVREYVDHLGRLVVTTNAKWNHLAGTPVWEADQASASRTATKRTIGGATSALEEKLEAKIDTSSNWQDTAWDRIVIERNIESASGQDTLEMPTTQVTIGANDLGDAAKDNRARMLLPFDSTVGRRTRLTDSIDNASDANSRYTIYRKSGTSTIGTASPFSAFARATERVYGATWNDGTSLWTPSSGNTALKFVESASGFGVGYSLAGANFDETDWNRVWSWDAASGLLVAADTEFTGTSTFTGASIFDGTATFNGTTNITGTLSVAGTLAAGKFQATTNLDTSTPSTGQTPGVIAGNTQLIAYGDISVNSAGTGTSVFGYNYSLTSGLTTQVANDTIRVTFTTAPPSARYIVMTQIQELDPENANIENVVAGNRTTASFDLISTDVGRNNGETWADISAGTVNIIFAVIGF